MQDMVTMAESSTLNILSRQTYMKPCGGGEGSRGGEGGEGSGGGEWGRGVWEGEWEWGRGKGGAGKEEEEQRRKIYKLLKKILSICSKKSPAIIQWWLFPPTTTTTHVKSCQMMWSFATPHPIFQYATHVSHVWCACATNHKECLRNDSIGRKHYQSNYSPSIKSVPKANASAIAQSASLFFIMVFLPFNTRFKPYKDMKKQNYLSTWLHWGGEKNVSFSFYFSLFLHLSLSLSLPPSLPLSYLPEWIMNPSGWDENFSPMKLSFSSVAGERLGPFLSSFEQKKKTQ